MEVSSPVKFWPMNVEQYVKHNFIKEVKSLLMYEPSSTQFNVEGLYSEDIFGQIGSVDRFAKLGYIDLHAELLHPLIYVNVCDVASMYDDILKGTQYAIFNPDKNVFETAFKDDENSDTGYTFFMKYFKKLVFERNDSVLRNNKISVIEKAQKDDSYKITKMLVCPAGWRDIRVDDDGHIKTEYVNKLYASLLALSFELENNMDLDTLIPYFDGIKYNIQQKIKDIYLYFKDDIISGKFGFIQQHYVRRSVAYGCRDVISTPDMISSTPTDPRYLKHNETLQPLFLLAVAFTPLVIHQLNILFTSQIYTFGSINVPAIDKDYHVKYVEVSPENITDELSSASKERFIQEFKNTEIRQDPVTVEDVNGEKYYLWLVYDLGDSIYLFRDINDLSHMLDDATIDMEKIRPLTRIEMLYIATYLAIEGKYVTVTRYPVDSVGSIFPSIPVCDSTTPSRMVKFKSQFDKNNESAEFIFPRYPVIGATKYIDSVIVHPSKTGSPGLNADFDGDTISTIGIYTQEALEEVKRHINSLEYYITSDGSFLPSAGTLVSRLVLNSLTYVFDKLPVAE